MLPIINVINNSLKDNNFSYIYRAAKITKCNIFYVEGNQLFGTPLEPYKVHVIDLPFRINGSLIFEISNNSTNIDFLSLEEFEYFQTGPELRYAFVPIRYYEDYCNGYIRLMYNDITKSNIVFNINTNDIIQGIPAISSEEVMNKLGLYINQIYNTRNFMSLKFNSIYNQYYHNIENDPQIQKVSKAKVTNGASIVVFGENNDRKAFTFFKGFLNNVKADSVDLEIIPDSPGSFMTIFYINHKKSALSKDILGDIIGERIYCRFLDI